MRVPSIKQQRNLLQTRPLGLRKEDIYDCELDRNPHHVKEVELPCESFDAERVDVRVKGTTHACYEPEKCHALRADRVRQDLDDLMAESVAGWQ